MKQKILFIVPPCISSNQILSRSQGIFSGKIRKEVPLGVLSLAAYIKKHHQADIKIIDFNVIFYDAIMQGELADITDINAKLWDTINALSEIYDFSGIAAIFSPAYEYIGIISEMLHKRFPSILITAGGGVPTNMPSEVFADAPYVEYIIHGEGEIPVLGLIQADDVHVYVGKSPSILSREKLQHNIKGKFELIANLDDIPRLDFDLIDFSSYNHHTHQQKQGVNVTVPLMFSRGCPFCCCFCASHSVHGRNVRYNTMLRIKADVEYYVEKYHVNTITVWDDNFFAKKEMAIELLQFFSEKHLTIEFVNSVPVYRVDEEIAQYLKQAGVDVVSLAIESGSDKVLQKIIHKPLRINMVPKAIDVLRKYDFYVKAVFVIGFPGETLEDIEETMQFIHESKLNWVDIFIAAPLPGSELLEQCLAGGYLQTNNLKEISFWKGGIETEHFTAEQLEKVQQYNMLKKDYVDNLDIREEHWGRALLNFEYVIKAKHENPFAYYYAALAAKKLGYKQKADIYYQKYKDIRELHTEWNELFSRFEQRGTVFAKKLLR